MASRPRLAAVTFDFYNTLVCHRDGRGRGKCLIAYLNRQGLRPAPWDHQILYHLFERHDADYSPTASSHARARYLRWLPRRVFELLDVDAPRWVAESHAAELWGLLGPDAFAVFPETRGVLAALRERGLRLAVISNWQRGLRHFVTELSLDSAFDHVLSSAEVGSAKPEHGIFERACRLLECAPQQVLHVGDTVLDDFEGARGAGLEAVLIRRAPEPESEGMATVSSLDQLLDMLEQRSP